MKIALNQNALNKIAIVIILLFEFSRNSWGMLIENNIWMILLFLSCFLILISHLISNELKIYFNSDTTCILIMMLIICLDRNYDISQVGLLNVAYRYIYILIICVLLQRNNNWINVSFSVMRCMSVFYAIVTIVSNLYSEVYYGYLYPLLLKYMNKQNWFTPHPSAGFCTDFGMNGIYLSIGFCVLIVSVFFSADNKKTSSKDIIEFGVVLLALCMNGKRAIILCMSLAFFVGYWNYTSIKKRGRIIKIVGIGLMMIFVVYISSFFIPDVAYIIDRLFASPDGEDVSSGRLQMWSYAWEKFIEKPWFGYGWNWYIYNNTVNPGAGVHNTILQLLVETGVIGTIPFIYFFIKSYVNVFKLSLLVRKGKVENLSLQNIYFALILQTYLLSAMFLGMYFYIGIGMTTYFISTAIVNYYKRLCRNKLSGEKIEERIQIKKSSE